jgi:hypothetical protein
MQDCVTSTEALTHTAEVRDVAVVNESALHEEKLQALAQPS